MLVANWGPMWTLLLSIALFVPSSLSQQQNCPSAEWIENGAFCYLLVKGANGRTFDQARADCQGRGSGSDLLWISDDSELSWFQDYSARQWNIKRDWGQCTDCVGSIEAAWIGAYRSDTGIFKWTKDDRAIDVKLNWWSAHPKNTPADYVIADDTGSQIRYRSETNEAARKFWHFCKVQHSEPPTSTPMSTTTLPPYLGPCPTRDWIEQGDSCYLLVKGETGRGVDEAARDCSSRSSQAGLLWIESADEASWVLDYSKATWNLRRDWPQCKDCQPESAAWMSLRRSGGVWSWGDKPGIDQSAISWFVGHPRDPPNDFGSLYDTGSQLRVRSETAASKMWHICKIRFRENTATTPTPTTPAPHTGVCPGPEWLEYSAWCYLLVKGDSGRTFEQAKTDCRSRGPDTDLLWIETDAEHTWWVDYSERSWNIKADWAQCKDCYGAAGAWIGLQRDSSGFFRWVRNDKALERNPNWFPGGIKESPADFVYLFDTDTQLRFRTEVNSIRLWHFCKTNHTEYTGPTDAPRTTPPMTPSTTALATTTTQPTTTRYIGNCPSSEWTEFEHSCYLLVKGSNGKTYSDARVDCQARKADLLWVTSDREMAWIRDYRARMWGIKQDWRQCTNCGNIEAAWFGMYRDLNDGKFKWSHDLTDVKVDLNWWTTDPLQTPNDYGLIFDTGSQLRIRLQPLDRALWHFCKIDYEESTATMPKSTSPTPRPSRYPPGPCVNTDWTAYGDNCYTLVKSTYGVSWSGALFGCKAQDSRADVLWMSSQEELQWLLDFSARNWGLAADFRQCLNCTRLEAAWIGLFRDSSGNFRWKKDLSNNTLDLSKSWFFNHPKDPPSNFVAVYETSSRLYLRTEVHDSSFWYFCKYNYRQSSSPPTQPTLSTPTSSAGTTMKPMGPCPQVGEPWTEYNGHCYSVRRPRQGLTWLQARDACRSVSESSDLAWIDSESELAWLVDYSARSWNIKADWRSCSDCSNVEGAWIGLFRDEEHDGLLKWAYNGRAISIVPNWWPQHPKESPNNYGLLFDTGSALRMRTEAGTGKYWYFCKAVGSYPPTQPTQSASFWTSGAFHILWVIPVLLVLGGVAFYVVRIHRRRSAPSNLESAARPVMTRENPAFNSYYATGNVQSNGNKSASLAGDAVAVTLKDMLDGEATEDI